MNNKIITSGIPDSEFIRGKVPMTKEEVRVITLSKLRLQADDVLLDIGAGTGSISIEAARLLSSGRVVAVEHNAEAVELIRQNVQKFGVGNLQLIEGSAPEVLAGISGITKAVVGGTGGHLTKVLEWLDANLPVGGRVVANAVTLGTLNGLEKFFRERGYVSVEIVQVAISCFEPVSKHLMLKANTPVFVVTAEKGLTPNPSSKERGGLTSPNFL